MLLGQEARFFQDLGDRARAEPIMRIAPGAKKTLMQPAYVDDVGVAIANAVHMDWEDVKGRTYELGGPTTFTYEELVEMTVSMVQRDTPLVEFSERFEFINKAISGFVGGLADRFRLDSLDRQRLTQENCLVSGEHPGFEDLNVTPQELKDMLFTSLHRHRTDNSFMAAN
jgi:NADH dehydrogenase